MTPDNFLFLEPLIKDALRARLDPRVFVLSAADLGVAEDHQPTPAVHVLYTGYRVADSDNGFFVGLAQTWLTVVVTAHLGDIVGGEDARQLAGPLAADVIDALHFKRLGGASPLQLTQAPAAGFSAGHFYLPLAWNAPIIMERDACPN